jgi:hypothetical protein
MCGQPPVFLGLARVQPNDGIWELFVELFSDTESLSWQAMIKRGNTSEPSSASAVNRRVSVAKVANQSVRDRPGGAPEMTKPTVEIHCWTKF